MTTEQIYQAGVDSFLTGKFTTPIVAIAQYQFALTKEKRFKFAEGFKWAQSLFK